MLNFSTFMTDTVNKLWVWGDLWIENSNMKWPLGTLSVKSLIIFSYIVDTDFSFPCSLHRRNLEVELMFYLPMKPYCYGVSIKLPAIPMWVWRTSPKVGVMGWPSMHSYMLTGKSWWITSGRVAHCYFYVWHKLSQGQNYKFLSRNCQIVSVLSHWRPFLNGFSLLERKDQKLLLGGSFSWV